MYSLDSDTVNNLLRANPNIARRVRAVNSADLWVSTIVLEEVVGKQINHLNTLRSQRRPLTRASEFLAELTIALSAFQILPYSDEAEQLYQSWPTKQKRVGPNDCRIVASAIVAGLVVVTCNQKDFSTIPGLVWEDWSRE